MTQLTQLTLPAPAKLNLFLHITGRRADGYHELQTLFQLLDFGDTLTFSKNQNLGIRLTCSDRSLETNDNLVIQAAKALETASGLALNVDIHLTKRLPMGGGIGGGSSDCATTLLGLNRLFDLNLTEARLLDIASQLGADVPVFVRGRSAWAEGIGEQLTPIDLPQQTYVVIRPHEHVATAKLFGHADLPRNSAKVAMHAELAVTGHNDFEPLVRALYPTINSAFIHAQRFGNAKLTGTGACLFLPVAANEAEKISQQLLQQCSDVDIFTACSVNESPVHKTLNTMN